MRDARRTETGMHAGHKQKTSFCEIIIYISKGKGGRTGDIEVHFTVKKKCERFSE